MSNDINQATRDCIEQNYNRFLEEKAKVGLNITPPYEVREAEVKQKAKDRELALRLLSTLTSYSEPNALSSVFREQVINLCKTQL